MTDENFQNAKIKVIGVGGGGSNAVNQMINDKKDLVEYWVFNTETQALSNSPCEHKFVLGKNVTKGLGAGGDPKMGAKAAEDSYEEIKQLVKNTDLVFLACGEGGGTGTGATPIIAKAAKSEGCLVLAIVTRPFNFEGKVRRNNALEGITELRKYVDAIIVVSNDKLVFNSGNMSLLKAFNAADKVLAESVKTITDLILIHGLINLDFADVKRTLENKGVALIGIGEAEGENKAVEAAKRAISSPLLEVSIKGARSMIINVTIGQDVLLDEVSEAISTVSESCQTSPQEQIENVKFGVQVNPNYKDKIKVAVIATNFAKDIQFDDKFYFISGDGEGVEEEEVDSTLPNYLNDFLAEEESKKNKTGPSTIADLKIQHEKEEKEQQKIEEEKEIEQRTMENPLYDFFSGNEDEDNASLDEHSDSADLSEEEIVEENNSEETIEEESSAEEVVDESDDENVSTIIVDDYEGDEDVIVEEVDEDDESESPNNIELDSFDDDLSSSSDEDDDDSIVIDRPL